MSDVIEAMALVKTYDAEEAPVRAVDHVDLAVTEGETVSVMGPSGCGKSTLLHLIGGLERGDGGELRLGGERVDVDDSERRGVRVGTRLVDSHSIVVFSLYPQSVATRAAEPAREERGRARRSAARGASARRSTCR